MPPSPSPKTSCRAHLQLPIIAPCVSLAAAGVDPRGGLLSVRCDNGSARLVPGEPTGEAPCAHPSVGSAPAPSRDSSACLVGAPSRCRSRRASRPRPSSCGPASRRSSSTAGSSTSPSFRSQPLSVRGMARCLVLLAHDWLHRGTSPPPTGTPPIAAWVLRSILFGHRIVETSVFVDLPTAKKHLE